MDSPVEPEPSESESDPLPALEKDPSQRMYEEADDLSQDGRYYDASMHGLRAYQLLDPSRMFGPSGLYMLKQVVEWHLRAYTQTRDPILLANIQRPLEMFLENFEGHGADLRLLERKLDTIRSKRLEVSDALFSRKKYEEAAEEAAACYQAMPPAAQGGPTGEQAVFQASLAYRSAWYIDNDYEHFDRGLALVEDHIQKAPGVISRRI
ncbi:MAG: hypothetical protein KDK70_06330, partial [Myxococcales bacterium]|nr:hypothetical protein [Myxococcales bacterium]